jgi:hypothetical protein
MTFRQGGILRSMTDDERRRQMDRVQDAIRITERQATPDELTQATALLAIEPSTRQPELDLIKKA